MDVFIDVRCMYLCIYLSIYGTLINAVCIPYFTRMTKRWSLYGAHMQCECGAPHHFMTSSSNPFAGEAVTQSLIPIAIHTYCTFDIFLRFFAGVISCLCNTIPIRILRRFFHHTTFGGFGGFFLSGFHTTSR
jgi:hypothetical protein